MGTRLPAFYSADMKRRRIEVDLLPPKVCDLRRSEAMPIGNENHRRIPVTVSIVLCSLDELLDLGLSQVLPAAKLSIWLPLRGNCSFFGGWLHHAQVRFCWHFSPHIPFHCS